MVKGNPDKKNGNPANKASSGKKIVAILLGIGWFAMVLYAVFFVNTPMSVITDSGNQTVSSTGHPTYRYNFDITVYAKGVVSANNPVTLSVVLSNLNATKSLLDDYCCIGFTGAHGIRESDGAVTSNLGRLPIKAQGDGTYVAEGDLVWLASGDTWLVVLPNDVLTNDLSVPTSSLKVGDPAFTVGTVSDTLSWQNNELMQKLTWVLIGFSIIACYPLSGAFFQGAK